MLLTAAVSSPGARVCRGWGVVFAFIRVPPARAWLLLWGCRRDKSGGEEKEEKEKKKHPSKSLILIQKESERGYEQYSSVPLGPPARRRRRNHFPH